MVSDNKLLQSILQAGAQQAQVIADENAARCAAVQAQAEEAAAERKSAILKEAQATVEAIRKAAESNATLVASNQLLAAKRDEIDKTIEALAAHILALEDEAYFDFLYRLAAQAEKVSGEVFISARDKQRLPKDFKEQLQAAGIDATAITVSEELRGGMLIRSERMEMNYSLDALIEEKRDALEDYIHTVLFVQEG